MTARVALLAVWASHALLSPLAIVLLFNFFLKHFYAEASPGSRCDLYLGLDASLLESVPEGGRPSEGREKARRSRVGRTNKVSNKWAKITACPG